ncbi:MAG: RecX family transcriptional regulator [Clostridia bacterium]|nr:RecX family transcriptional regulator [Clostridia bacterium]
MSKITQLKLQTKNKERVNVHLDGEFFCGLQAETVIKHSLKVGDDIEQDELTLLQFESEKQMAFNKVLNLISKRQKTQKQIQTYLSDKYYGQKTIDYVIAKLKEYNYINDELFAKNYVLAYCHSKGKKRLKQELLLKGVGIKIIDEVLSNLEEQDEVVKELVQKYMKNKEKSSKTMTKLYAFLMRRGFSYDEIKPFLKGYEE